MIKYKWLAGRLETAILQSIRDGVNKLPTEAELCKKYHVSRQTVRMSLSLLEERGLITRRQGSGSFITGRFTGEQGNVIGILISSDQEYIYPALLGDMKKTLAGNGFSSRVFLTDNQVGQERKILRELLERPPRGLIVEGCKSALPNPNLDLYRQLLKRDCKIVFLFNHYPALPGCLFIKDDNFSGSALLVRHLAAQGHTAIGGIFKADDLQGIERYHGFVETLRELSLPITDSRICWYTSRELDKLLRSRDTRFLKEMLSEVLPSCTAVVCYNDIIAYYLIDVLLQAGYSLPRDMAIAAFDNTYFSNSDILTVTTLSHRPHEMGTLAADAILAKLKGLPAYSQEIPWELNLKESTKTE